MVKKSLPAGPTVLPGDIVQVTDKRSPYFTALMVIEDVRPRFAGARLGQLDERGKIAAIYCRLPAGSYDRAGTAILVSAEIAKARELTIETARLLEADRKTQKADR